MPIRYLVSILIIFLFLLSSSALTANAQVEENKRIRQVGETSVEREAMQETRVEQVKLRAGNKQEQIKRHTDRLTSRFGFYIRRLENVLQKLRTRLEFIDNQGNDVSEALSKLDEADATLKNAQVLSELAIEAFSNIEEISSQKEEVLAAKELVEEARAEFRKAVSLMRESIQLAKTSMEDAK